MVHKLSRFRRIEKFTQLEGWFSEIMTQEYTAPENSTKQNIDRFHVLKLKYTDPDGNYALYKCLQLVSQTVFDNLTGVGATTSTINIQGVVASYDRNTGQIKMELVDMDDKTMFSCTGNGKKFRGTSTEFGVNTAATNDVALRGGFVGGFTLEKLYVAPTGFESFNFDVAYKTRYDIVYPLGDN
jgi:hypothetical protein